MENNVNAKIKKLINHIYGESFSDAHLNVLLTKLEKAALAQRVCEDVMLFTRPLNREHIIE